MTTSTDHPNIHEYSPTTLPAVEVFEEHRSRRLIVPNLYPRIDLRVLPKSRRVAVRTPAGVVMKCLVRFKVVDGYVVASARPNDHVHGECEDASGAFPLSCELEAERIALESL